MIEPQSTGIGGGCFRPFAPGGSDRIVAVAGSGRATTQHFFDRFHDGTITLSSGSAHAVTVPGALSAWEALLRPALGFAENG